MSLLNTTCTYAIRAALEVAAQRPRPGEYVSTRRVAESLDVSFAFLGKVLQGLVQNGVLLSQRGAAGGVSLARPAESTTLLDVLRAAGGDGIFRDCVLGLPSCSDSVPCALHQSWKEERARLESLFAHTTLADLAGEGGSGSFEDPDQPTGHPRVRGTTRRRPP